MAGERFGRYVLDEPIAEGGMGQVWKARLESGLGLGKVVALKRIATRLSGDPEFVAMFVEEARISLALSHPNIVQVFDAGREGGHLFLAMEFVDGKNLHDVIVRARRLGPGRIPLAHVLFVACEVARALEHAHRRRGPDGRRLAIVHRDVSPGNILCSFEGDVKLGDFGLAKSTIRAYQSMFGTIKGKAAYMAPEQARAEPVDARADIFGLGAVIYEMLAGRGLYADVAADGDALDAARRARFPRLGQVAPDVAPDLAAVVEQALAARPEDRFASADALRAALERYAAGAGLVLSAADFSAFVLDLFEVPSATVPPHPFAAALGLGLGLGAARPTPEAIDGVASAALAPTPRAEPARQPSLARTTMGLGPAAASATVPTATVPTATVPTATVPTASVPTPPVPTPRATELPPTTLTPYRRAGGVGPVTLLLVAALGGAGGLVWVKSRNADVPAAGPPVSPPALPSTATGAAAAQVPVDPRREGEGASKVADGTGGSTGGRPVDTAHANAGQVADRVVTPRAGRSAPTPAAAPREGGAGDPPAKVAPEPDSVPPAPAATLAIGSDPWAEVAVDGRPTCRTPLGCRNVRLEPGAHTVSFSNPVARLCKTAQVLLTAGANPPLTVKLEPCP